MNAEPSTQITNQYIKNTDGYYVISDRFRFVPREEFFKYDFPEKIGGISIIILGNPDLIDPGIACLLLVNDLRDVKVTIGNPYDKVTGFCLISTADSESFKNSIVFSYDTLYIRNELGKLDKVPESVIKINKKLSTLLEKMKSISYGINNETKAARGCHKIYYVRDKETAQLLLNQLNKEFDAYREKAKRINSGGVKPVGSEAIKPKYSGHKRRITNRRS